MTWMADVNWRIEYIGNYLPADGAVKYLYTSKDAPVEADEFKALQRKAHESDLVASELQREVVALRYYVAELEKLVREGERKAASNRARGNALGVTYTDGGEITPTEYKPDEMPKPKPPRPAGGAV